IYIERLWRNVKQENIYLNAYETGLDLYKGLEEYFYQYNNHRVHQALNYLKPIDIYKNVA
ncbi:MAG TPA: integrase core domain-containing protein, partial [Candidatus Cloacimonas acidaminovorans]|nr:integrase core domain-containing protein [Candidatus Cloacimonas acidaminovorans]